MEGLAYMHHSMGEDFVQFAAEITGISPEFRRNALPVKFVIQISVEHQLNIFDTYTSKSIFEKKFFEDHLDFEGSMSGIQRMTPK